MRTEVEFRWLGKNELELLNTFVLSDGWTFQKLIASAQEGRVCAAFTRDPAGREKVSAFILLKETSEALDICYLETRPDQRRQGLMRALFDWLLFELKPGQKVWLEVHNNNQAARGLYEQLGFHKCGERKGYYKDGGSASVFEFKPLQ